MQLSPINFSIKEKELSIVKGNTDLMEGNEYPVAIQTDDDLNNGYNLYIKPYGSSQVTQIGSLKNHPTRLIIITDNTDAANPKKYWGYLQEEDYLFANENEEFATLIKEDFSKYSIVENQARCAATLLSYKPVEENTVIPEIKKVSNYELDRVGYAIFIYTQLDNEGQTDIFDLKQVTIETTDLEIEKISTEILEDFSQILSPPPIEGKVQVPQQLNLINGSFSIDATETLGYVSNIVEDEDFYTDDEDEEDFEIPEDDELENNEELSVILEDEVQNENGLTDEDIYDITTEEEGDVIIPDEEEEEEENQEETVVLKDGKVEIHNINFEFSSYNQETGRYIYKKIFTDRILDKTLTGEGDEEELLENSDNSNEEFFSIELDGEPEEEGITKEFDGEIVISFDENDFSNYSLELIGELNYVKDEVNNVAKYLSFIIENNSIKVDIDYSQFTFLPEEISKSNFITAPQSFLNLYTSTIPAAYVTLNYENFFLGVGKEQKKENEDDPINFVYFTNPIEFNIVSSMMSSTNWEKIDSLIAPTDKYAWGFIKINSAADNKIEGFYSDANFETEILGRVDTLYLDLTALNNSTTINLSTVKEKIDFYNWEPFNGFYLINSTETLEGQGI